MNTRNNRRTVRSTIFAAIAAVGLGSSALACDPADYNMSGTVGLEDLQGFMTAYLAGDKSADINFDGSVSVQDLFDFVAYWVPSYNKAGQSTPPSPSPKPTGGIANPTPDDHDLDANETDASRL